MSFPNGEEAAGESCPALCVEEPKSGRCSLSVKSIFKGAAAEARLAAYLIDEGNWVFSPLINHDGPIDLIAVNAEGEITLFDAKADSFRINPGKKTPHRIYRVRKKIQRDLGVKIAYVDGDGKVSITDHD